MMYFRSPSLVIAAIALLHAPSIRDCEGAPQDSEIDPEAFAAAAIEAAGGRVERNTDGQITRVKFFQVESLGGKTFDIISELKHVREITITGLFDPVELDGGCCRLIARVKGLRRLTLSHAHVTDLMLADLKGLDELIALDLSETEITDASLPLLTNFPALKELDLSKTQITDAGLAELAPLVNLETLDLSDNKHTAAGIANLKPLVNLKELNLGCWPLSKTTNDVVDTLVGFAELRALNVANSGITDDGLIRLCTLAKLEKLDVSGALIGDRGAANLAKLKELRSINLSETRITDKTLPYLAFLKNLQELSIWDTRVQGPGVWLLKKVYKIESINHDPLPALRRADNFVEFRRTHLEVDRGKSEIAAYLSPDDDDVYWKISVNCTDEFVPFAWSPPHVETPLFEADIKDWRDLASKEVSIQLDEEKHLPLSPETPGHFYIGRHFFTNNHQLRFSKWTDTAFSVDWTGIAKEEGYGGAESFRIKAHLDFAKVVVWFEDRPIDFEVAKKTLHRHFKPQDFGEPRKAKFSIEFPMKPPQENADE